MKPILVRDDLSIQEPGLSEVTNYCTSKTKKTCSTNKNKGLHYIYVVRGVVKANF